MIRRHARTHQQCDSGLLLTCQTKRGNSGTRRSPGVKWRRSRAQRRRTRRRLPRTSSPAGCAQTQRCWMSAAKRRAMPSAVTRERDPEPRHDPQLQRSLQRQGPEPVRPGAESMADQLRWCAAPAWGHHGDQRTDNPGDGPAPRPGRPGVPVLERDAVRVKRGGLTGVLSGHLPSSSTPTELPDAIQRAEFNQTAKADWHTELAPRQHPGHLPHHPARAHIHEQARAREKLHRQPRRLRRSRAPAASTASSTASHGNALASMPTEILSPRLPSSRSTR